MTAIDIAGLRRHMGTPITDEDVVSAAPLRVIAATFDRDETAPGEGEAIPEVNRAHSSLGPDGTPSGSGVLPKLPLPRRK
jgi:hypothetical protein